MLHCLGELGFNLATDKLYSVQSTERFKLRAMLAIDEETPTQSDAKEFIYAQIGEEQLGLEELSETDTLHDLHGWTVTTLQDEEHLEILVTVEYSIRS